MQRIVAACVFCLGLTTIAQAGPTDIYEGPAYRNVFDVKFRVVNVGEEALRSDGLNGAKPTEATAGASDGSAAGDGAGAGTQVSSSQDTKWLGFWMPAQDYSEVEAWLGRRIWVAHFHLAFGRRGFAQALGERQKVWLESYTRLAPHAQLAVILDIFPLNDKNPRFAEIDAGDWDEELRQVARRIIDAGHEDAILRLWHEPEVAVKNNSPIGPTWCDDPAFVPAWRHVHDLFEAEPGAEFVWQYSVNGPAGKQLTAADGTLWIEKCYPGPEYVDQVSVGAYHRMGPTPEISWQESIGKLEFGRDWAFEQGHKFSVAEWGLWSSACRWEGQDDDPSFIQGSHDFFAAIPEEKRGYMLYFNAMKCVDIAQYPESEALFEKLFGG